jgi:hypothetical protein
MGCEGDFCIKSLLLAKVPFLTLSKTKKKINKTKQTSKYIYCLLTVWLPDAICFLPDQHILAVYITNMNLFFICNNILNS